MALIPSTEDNSVKVQSILIRDRGGDVIQPAPDEMGIQVIAAIAYLVDRFGGLTPIGSAGTVGMTALTGDVVAAGVGIVAAVIPPQTVTFAKMQNVSANIILGNPTGVTGSVQEMSAATTRTLLGLASIATSASATDLTSGTLPAARFGPLTGDVTTSGYAATLAATAVVAGTYLNASIVVDAKGRLTLATAFVAAATQVVYGGAAGAFAQSSTLTYNSTTRALTITALDSGTFPHSSLILNHPNTTPGNSRYNTIAFQKNGADVAYITGGVQAGTNQYVTVTFPGTGTETSFAVQSGTSGDYSFYTSAETGDTFLGLGPEFLTTATTGFVYLPGAPGAFTGTPATPTVGGDRTATGIDTTNHRFYAYLDGAWRFTSFDNGSGSGNVTGTFVTGEIAFASGTHALTGDTSFTYDAGSQALTVGNVQGASTLTLLNSSTPTTAVTLSTVITLTGPVVLGSLTTNGFVKTSGGTGALSIDTATYLSGTLTAGRVPFVATTSTLTDDAAFTYDSVSHFLKFASTSAAQEIQQSGNQSLGIGTGSGNTSSFYVFTNHTSRVAVSGSAVGGGKWDWGLSTTIASAAPATLDQFDINVSTVTITGNTNITTIGGFNLATIRQPTYTSASAVTITNAATLVIEGSPATGGSTTITNAYALWIKGGIAVMDTITSNGGVNLLLERGGTQIVSIGATDMTVVANIVPSANTTYNLGDSTHAWAVLWVQDLGKFGNLATMTFGGTGAGSGLTIDSNTTGMFEITHQSTNGRWKSDITGISFFGGLTVAQQTGGAATAGAVYTATEQGMLDRAYQALRAYGLLT